MLQAAFVLGVVTATDPQTQVSDTANGATLVGGYRLRLLGTPLRQCREGTIPRAAAPCLKALGQIQKVGAGVRPEPEAGCPQAPPTSWSVRGSPGGTLSGKGSKGSTVGLSHVTGATCHCNNSTSECGSQSYPRIPSAQEPHMVGGYRTARHRHGPFPLSQTLFWTGLP